MDPISTLGVRPLTLVRNRGAGRRQAADAWQDRRRRKTISTGVPPVIHRVFHNPARNPQLWKALWTDHMGVIRTGDRPLNGSGSSR